MKVIKIMSVLSVCAALSCCSSRVVQSDSIKNGFQLGSSDKILVFPVEIVRELGSSSEALRLMHETILGIELTKAGFIIVEAAGVKSAVTTDKLSFKELLAQSGAKALLQAKLIQHAREELSGKQNIFIVLKLISAEGETVRITSDHYEGDEGGLEAVAIQNLLKQSLTRLTFQLKK